MKNTSKLLNESLLKLISNLPENERESAYAEMINLLLKYFVTGSGLSEVALVAEIIPEKLVFEPEKIKSETNKNKKNKISRKDRLEILNENHVNRAIQDAESGKWPEASKITGKTCSSIDRKKYNSKWLYQRSLHHAGYDIPISEIFTYESSKAMIAFGITEKKFKTKK